MKIPNKYNFIAIILQILTNKVNSESQRPNIVLILADDLGINDVSFRGSNQFLTPNIDALAYHGTILNRYYVPAMCTPSRSTLLTGKYPIHTGMQHFVIPNHEPWGLPLEHKIMPEILKKNGYSTNLVGKWHLGFFKKAYTPTFRGFDYHYGYYGGYIGYYDHSEKSSLPIDKGYDFRKNLNVEYDGNGTYATDLFTDESVRIIREHNATQPLFLMVTHLAAHAGNEDDPFEAPPNVVDKFRHIKDPNRRMYAAMVSKLDESVGKIVMALENKRILDNTIVIFYSDNGAPTVGQHANSGSNYPLRGQKNSPWEGGIRSPGIIYSPLLKYQRRILDQVVYAGDWLPTLASAAHISLDSSIKLDGQNLWDELQSPNPNIKQREIVNNIDDIDNYVSYMKGKWKYINGTTENGSFDSWLGVIGSEVDPKSLNYANTILETELSQVLQMKDYPLDIQTINNLREKTYINCKELSKPAEKTHYYKCTPEYQECLFDLEQDPCEHFNLAADYPEVLLEMRNNVENYRKSAMKPARVKTNDLDCDPKLFNGTWTFWKEYKNSAEAHKYQNTFLLISICILSSFFSF